MPPPMPGDPFKTPQPGTKQHDDSAERPEMGVPLDEAAQIITWNPDLLPYIRRGPPYPPRDIQ